MLTPSTSVAPVLRIPLVMCTPGPYLYVAPTLHKHTHKQASSPSILFKMLYLFDTASRGLAPLVAMETTIRQQRYTSFCVCFFFFFCITPHQTTAFSAATAVTTWRVGVMLDACVCDGT